MIKERKFIYSNIYLLASPLENPVYWARVVSSIIKNKIESGTQVFYEIFDWNNNCGFEFDLVHQVKCAGDLGKVNLFDFDRSSFIAKSTLFLSVILLTDWSINIDFQEYRITIHDEALILQASDGASTDELERIRSLFDDIAISS